MSGFLAFALGVASTLGFIIAIVRVRRGWPRPVGDFPPQGGEQPKPRSSMRRERLVDVELPPSGGQSL